MRSSSSLCGKGSMIVVKQPISTTSRSGSGSAVELTAIVPAGGRNAITRRPSPHSSRECHLTIMI